MASREEQVEIIIRPAEEADTDACGRICYDAFRIVNERHGFPSVFPSLEIATRRVAGFIRHPSIFAVVAEDGDRNGQIIGFNFLSERDPMRAIGPIAVNPTAHGSGIGRRLMEAVLERARGARSIRLLQETYNVQSLSLYAALGFDPRELFVVMAGIPRGSPLSDWQIRHLTTADLAECEALHERLQGYPRTSELRDAVATGAPVAVFRDGRIRAYMAVPTSWLPNHGVGESEDDMQALIVGTAQVVKEPVSFLLPVRHAALFRWCLAQGLRSSRPMTLMTIGDYREPSASYFPSVCY